VSGRILTGDALAMLKTLPDDSVHCCVTSPPYWGLRDYGVEGQIGLEATPAEFIARMVEVFEEVRCVLRPDGTCWVNMGDSYAGSWGAQGRPQGEGQMSGRSVASARQIGAHPRFESCTGTRGKEEGLKPKDLVGMPWRLALALQDAGWWLRQDIIWSKPNPMPESVRDRCTKAHEYIFLLAKSERYFFDAEAISEPVAISTIGRLAQDVENQAGSDRVPGKTNGPMKSVSKSGNKQRKNRHEHGGNPAHPSNQAFGVPWEGSTRNKRSVWTITTKGFSEAHFATFPPELPEICIKAGCPAGGTVLDPFFGAGTTGLVADRLGRDWIGIELNPAYAAMARRRIEGDAPLLAEIAA
jgi:DNA modification methylase